MTRPTSWVLLVWCCSCSSTVRPARELTDDAWVLHGATVLVDARHCVAAELTIRAGRIVSIGEGQRDLPRVDVAGSTVAPAFIDSHVHLAYRPEQALLAHAGIAAAVDLGAPLWFVTAAPGAVLVKASGPMVTAVGGYPTQSWGRNGYGLEVATVSEGEQAVERLADAGVALIKLPLDEFGPQLEPDVQRAVVARAHSLGLKVAAHALTDSTAAAAAALGVDVLAHTPTEPLKSSTLAAWAGKTVLSTLAAFGGSAAAVQNLKQLRAVGALVLYGTDFGNGETVGIDSRELQLLVQAGFDGPSILEAGTSGPAAFWSFDQLGSLAPGQAASFMVLDDDPRLDPSTLAHPRAVYLDGVLRPAP
jgi:imidazolonepropionase-like amidohydrolase